VEGVGSFGEHLRQQREMRGVSLDEIVAITKIGRRLLQALEEEQFDLLPGGIFNKSYVRAYAKCVGIDEDQAVAEYLEAAQEPPPDNKVIAHQHTFHSDRRPDRAQFPIVPVLILLVVAAGAVGGWKAYQEHQRDRDRQLAAATPPTAAVAPMQTSGAAPAGGTATSSATQSAQPAASSQIVPSSKPVSAVEESGSSHPRQSVASQQDATSAAGEFEVIIRPKDRAWVSVKSDGKYVVRGIIKPPDIKTIRATSEVIFFTGNAGEVDVAFNGKSVPLEGGANQQETVVFNSKGAQPQAPGQ
jgi:cytoskeleton protein RodZ